MEAKGEVLASKCQRMTAKSRKSARDGKLSFYIHYSKDWIRQESWMNEWMSEWNKRGNFDEKQDIFKSLPTVAGEKKRAMTVEKSDISTK